MNDWEVAMRRSIRRQFLFLRAYTIVSSLALIVGGAAAFRQASSPKEITVERLNIVDANGTLRDRRLSARLPQDK